MQITKKVLFEIKLRWFFFGLAAGVLTAIIGSIIH